MPRSTSSPSPSVDEVDREIDALGPAPAAFLVSGVPGAGKSTVGRALAERFERGAHIEADTMSDLLVSGRTYPAPNGQPRNDEGERQLLLRERNACTLATSLYRGAVVPVVDDVITNPPRLARYRQRLAETRFVFVVLAPHFDVVLERDRRRDKHWAHLFSHLDSELRMLLRGEGMWVDSTDQSVDETVDEIVSRWAQHMEEQPNP